MIISIHYDYLPVDFDARSNANSEDQKTVKEIIEPKYNFKIVDQVLPQR